MYSEQIVMPIMVEHTGSDTLGKRLVYELKEEIKKSESMKLSLKDELGIMVSIVTINSNKENTGNQTIYSIVWTWNVPAKHIFPYYLTSSVGYCGSYVINETAKDLVASTYEQSERMLKLLIKLIDTTEVEND